jgi:hypothetical protein
MLSTPRLADDRPDLAAHVHGIETVDHPSDDRLIALAREHFQIAT